jgi:hypothetical protein
MVVVVCAGLRDKSLEVFNTWLNNSSLVPPEPAPTTGTSQVVSLSARELSKEKQK